MCKTFMYVESDEFDQYWQFFVMEMMLRTRVTGDIVARITFTFNYIIYVKESLAQMNNFTISVVGNRWLVV